jgi:hypothetical protein
MATLPTTRRGWLTRFGANRGFSKETASPLWAITAWVIGLIVFFPVLYMFLTGFKSENAAVELPPKLVFWPTLENYEAVFGINFLPFFRVRLRPGALPAEEVEGRSVLLHFDTVSAGRGRHRAALRHLQPERRSRARRPWAQPAGNAAGIGPPLHGDESADRDLDAALVLRGSAP